MGLFNDNNHPVRHSWEYNYAGKELLVAATAKYKEMKAREMAARNNLADLLKDPAVSPQDKRIEQYKREIEKCGSESEQCVVWCHEFARNPDREYLLGLGDVTYFNLATPPE